MWAETTRYLPLPAKMDLPRTALIAAIVLLGFMLMSEWIAFEQRNIRTPVTSLDISQPPDTPNVVDIPAPSSDNSDVPTIIIEPQVEDDIISLNEAPAQRLIYIYTDKLLLHVDLRGGDIVHAALPQYKVSLENKTPLSLLEKNEHRTYIAQSGLIGRDGIDRPQSPRPLFTAEQQHYRLDDGQDQLVVHLSHTADNGVHIVKRLTLTRGDHLLQVDYLIDNKLSSAWRGVFFAQLKRDSSSDPSAERPGLGLASYLGAALRLDDQNYHKIGFDDMAEKDFKKSVHGGWLAMVQHYFISAWIPQDNRPYLYTTRVTQNGDNIIGFTAPTTIIPAGQSAVVGSALYIGPKDQYRLRDIANGLDLTIDYGFLWWIAQPLFWLLHQIQKYVLNWGLAIIGLTIVIKLVFFHLSATSYKSMAKMRKVQPKMVDIRERFKEDRARQSQEMMALYRTEKVNPLGGCLPLLLQMPVFIALYWVLLEEVELRHAPFFLWIKDLSVLDPYFVLPILMGATMWVQQKLNPPPPDPIQAKVMQWLPLVFTFFFLFFPAGLVLYWLVNNVLSIAQQWYIIQKIEKQGS